MFLGISIVTRHVMPVPQVPGRLYDCKEKEANSHEEEGRKDSNVVIHPSSSDESLSESISDVTSRLFCLL